MSGGRESRGSVTPSVIAAIGVVLVLAVGLGIVSGYLLALHRARQVADLAALSAAHEFTEGAEACQAAENIAKADKARVTDCAVIGDAIEFAVTVGVAVPIHPAIPGLPAQVETRASAGQILARSSG